MRLSSVIALVDYSNRTNWTRVIIYDTTKKTYQLVEQQKNAKSKNYRYSTKHNPLDQPLIWKLS